MVTWLRESVRIPSEGELAETLASIPTAAGVAQLVGPGDRSLMIAQAANLRRWTAGKLGHTPPPKKRVDAGGPADAASAARNRRMPPRRPPVNLRPIARELRYTVTSSGFHQRLVFERVMAAVVPLASRRDLKQPGWLRLDLGERFPRLVAVNAPEPENAVYGPFRDLAAAARARDALHKRFPLRPCDYVFEPDPHLPLGIGCVYAQVRSCAAPCLQRISEDGYRRLAREVAELLGTPPERAPEPWLPEWIGARSQRALVVERGDEGVELYPVQAGRVLDAQIRVAEPDIAAAVARLSWDAPADAADDTRWLTAWFYDRKRKGAYLPVRDAAMAADVEACIRRLLAAPSVPRDESFTR
jgi:hypothetical protein